MIEYIILFNFNFVRLICYDELITNDYHAPIYRLAYSYCHFLPHTHCVRQSVSALNDLHIIK